MIQNPEIQNLLLNIRKATLKWYKNYLGNYQIKKQNEIYSINNHRIREPSENYLINNPHDKSIRIVLSDKTEAANLINKALEMQISETEITEYKSSYITDEYRNREADIVYKSTKYDGVYFLIEHQSKIDYSMPLRIAEYSIEIIRSVINQSKLKGKSYRIPLVIPIVIYTGSRKWNANKYLKDCQAEMPNYEKADLGNYRLIDVNDFSDDELLKEKGVLPKVLLLEKTKEVEKIIENCYEIGKCDFKEKELKIINRYVRNVMGSEFGEEVVGKILSELNKNKKEEKDMFAEALREMYNEGIESGEKTGRKLGEQLGRQQKRKEMIIKMIQNNLNDELIKAISGVSNKELQNIKSGIIIKKINELNFNKINSIGEHKILQ